jgi:hypothetical protein
MCAFTDRLGRAVLVIHHAAVRAADALFDTLAGGETIARQRDPLPMIAEGLEIRRLLSSVAASSAANVGDTKTFLLNTAGSSSPTAINVNFGDGSSATLAGTATSTTHPFATAGSFMPTVTVTDANGTHAALALGLDPSFASGGTKLENSSLQWGEAHAALIQ